jgi:hypothetical protein
LSRHLGVHSLNGLSASPKREMAVRNAPHLIPLISHFCMQGHRLPKLLHRSLSDSWLRDVSDRLPPDGSVKPVAKGMLQARSFGKGPDDARAMLRVALNPASLQLKPVTTSADAIQGLMAQNRKLQQHLMQAEEELAIVRAEAEQVRLFKKNYRQESQEAESCCFFCSLIMLLLPQPPLCITLPLSQESACIVCHSSNSSCVAHSCFLAEFVSQLTSKPCTCTGGCHTQPSSALRQASGCWGFSGQWASKRGFRTEQSGWRDYPWQKESVPGGGRACRSSFWWSSSGSSGSSCCCCRCKCNGHAHARGGHSRLELRSHHSPRQRAGTRQCEWADKREAEVACAFERGAVCEHVVVAPAPTSS